MENNYDFDTIEAYLNGSMSPSDCKVLEDLIKSNPELALKVSAQRTANLAAIEFSRLRMRNHVRELYEQMDIEEKEKLPAPLPAKSDSFYWKIATVTLLTLLVAPAVWEQFFRKPPLDKKDVEIASLIQKNEQLTKQLKQNELLLDSIQKSQPVGSNQTEETAKLLIEIERLKKEADDAARQIRRLKGVDRFAVFMPEKSQFRSTGASSENKDYKIGMELFQNGKYEEAIVYFKKLGAEWEVFVCMACIPEKYDAEINTFLDEKKPGNKLFESGDPDYRDLEKVAKLIGKEF